MTDKAWLAALGLGDEVAYRINYGRAWATARIDRVTPTQFVVGQRRVHRKDGRIIGANGFGEAYSIEPVTDEVREHARRRRALEGIAAVSWSGLPTEKIEAALAAVSAS